jgi:protein phosphatase 2C family protein 2/3
VPSSAEAEESISEEEDRAGHRRPENEIHVDYYGPRGHIPSHN